MCRVVVSFILRRSGCMMLMCFWIRKLLMKMWVKVGMMRFGMMRKSFVSSVNSRVILLFLRWCLSVLCMFGFELFFLNLFFVLKVMMMLENELLSLLRLMM